jgi:hypothetical protein
MWKHVVVALLEILWWRLAGRTEKNHDKINKDNVSQPRFETTSRKHKSEALIPALTNLRSLYSSASFMYFQSPRLKLQFLLVYESDVFCANQSPQYVVVTFREARRKSKPIIHMVTYRGLCITGRSDASRNRLYIWSPI